jgi:hypothetical protein
MKIKKIYFSFIVCLLSVQTSAQQLAEGCSSLSFACCIGPKGEVAEIYPEMLPGYNLTKESKSYCENQFGHLAKVKNLNLTKGV